MRILCAHTDTDRPRGFFLFLNPGLPENGHATSYQRCKGLGLNGLNTRPTGGKPLYHPEFSERIDVRDRYVYLVAHSFFLDMHAWRTPTLEI